MATQEKTWNVANRIHSAKDSDNPALSHIVTGADEIYDDEKQRKQSVLNAQTDTRLGIVENDINGESGGIKDRLRTLENEVSFEGEIQVENAPLGIVSGSGKVATANAVRGSIDVRTGYFVCDTAAEEVAKVVAAVGFVLTVGGSIKVKMLNANTAAGVTLDINSTGAKTLYYDGEAVTAENTWEAGETVEVYYDGTNYYANNVAGGGKFSTGEKVKEVGIDDEPTAGSENLVKSGGVYNEKISPKIGYAIPINGTFNYNSTSKTLSFPVSFDIVSQNNSARYSYNGTDVAFVNTGDREQLLVFNTDNRTFKTVGGNTHFRELTYNDVVIGTVDTSANREFFNFPYSRDNLDVVRNNTDTVPTLKSTSLITSGGVKAAIDTEQARAEGVESMIPIYRVYDSIIGKGTTQIVISFKSKKGHYVLQNTDWSYTASSQAKIIVYGIVSSARVQLMSESPSSVRNPLMFDVNDDFDVIEIALRINEGEEVKKFTIEERRDHNSIGYALPINGTFSYNSNTRTLYFPTSFDIVDYNFSKRISVEEGSHIQFINNGSREQILLFSTSTNQFSTSNASQGEAFGLDSISLGTVDTSTGKEYFNFPYTKDGLDVVRNGYDSVPTKSSDKLLTSGVVFDALNSLTGDNSSVTSLCSHAAYGKDVFLRSFIEDYFNNLYWGMEESGYNAFLSKIRARKTNGVYQIAFVTDTHEGGQYAENGIFAFREIALFNKLSVYVDICAHGGDISCDYDTSLERQFAYLMDIMKMYKPQKPFLITKGNHDQRDKGYSEVSPLEVDWDNGVYYISPSFNVFQQVTKDTYRGGQLYIADGRGFMPDSWFRFIQSYKAPSTAVWGNGAYYYYDDEDYKIRFVVANSFPVNDNNVISESDEWTWFIQTALDLSDKNVPTDWTVVCLRHTESTSNAKFGRIVSAFMTGGSVTEAEGSADYGTLNGGGIKFLHIHGHEHGTAGYSNMAGYLDIGFRNGNVDKRNLGNPSYYNIYVISIDTNNKKLTSDTLYNNITLTYDYADNILELMVGQAALMARSGMSGQSGSGYTWTSSDDSIATVVNGVVTGVSAGTVTIVGVQLDKQKTVTYTVRITG